MPGAKGKSCPYRGMRRLRAAIYCDSVIMFSSLAIMMVVSSFKHQMNPAGYRLIEIVVGGAYFASVMIILVLVFIALSKCESCDRLFVIRWRNWRPGEQCKFCFRYLPLKREGPADPDLWG